jgi:hypothetical protein
MNSTSLTISHRRFSRVAKQKRNMGSALFIVCTFMLTLALTWAWTWILHAWALLGDDVALDKPSYHKALNKWKANHSMWDVSAYKFHPAWMLRYLHCCCYNYAQAYAKVRRLPIEEMTDEHDKMIHVYNVRRRKSDGKTIVRCIDLSGTRTRPNIKKYYDLPHSKSKPYVENFFPLRFWGEQFILERFIRATQ